MARRNGFYVIAGSHGVGKSTVLELCRAMLDQRGRRVATFHHRADKAAAPSLAGADTGAARPRWQRRLWRAVPVSLRRLAVALADEVRYARAIRRELAAAAGAGAPALADRYVYDRLIDLRLHRRDWHQIAAVGLACRVMRRPTMAFMLTDAPERIHARKAELAPDEIAAYQRELESLLRGLRVPYREIAVAGRPAEDVAHDVVTHMLADG